MLLIKSIKQGSCSVLHQQSGATLITDSPPEYGGRGKSFSATDLMAAALGVCIATNIDAVAVKYEIPLEAVEIKVQKTLSKSPKRIASLSVQIFINVPLPLEVLRRLQNAAKNCAVHRSLHPELKVEISFVDTVNTISTDR